MIVVTIGLSLKLQEIILEDGSRLMFVTFGRPSARQKLLEDALSGSGNTLACQRWCFQPVGDLYSQYIPHPKIVPPGRPFFNHSSLLETLSSNVDILKPPLPISHLPQSSLSALNISQPLGSAAPSLSVPLSPPEDTCSPCRWSPSPCFDSPVATPDPPSSEEEDDLRSQLALLEKRRTEVLEELQSRREEERRQDQLASAQKNLDEELATQYDLTEAITNLTLLREDKIARVNEAKARRREIENEIADLKSASYQSEYDESNGYVSAGSGEDAVVDGSRMTPGTHPSEKAPLAIKNDIELEKARKSRDTLLRLIQFRQKELAGRRETIFGVEQDIKNLRDEQAIHTQGIEKPLDLSAGAVRQSPSPSAVTLLPQLARAYVSIRGIGGRR